MLGDDLAVEVLGAGGRRDQDLGMVGGMEQTLRKGLMRIVAAGPSIAVGSAVAAADNTDQDNRKSAAGQSNLRRYIGSLRIAWKIKMRWRRWEGRGERVDRAGRGKKMGRLRELNKAKQTPA